MVRLQDKRQESARCGHEALAVRDLEIGESVRGGGMGPAASAVVAESALVEMSDTHCHDMRFAHVCDAFDLLVETGSEFAEGSCAQTDVEHVPEELGRPGEWDELTVHAIRGEGLHAPAILDTGVDSLEKYATDHGAAVGADFLETPAVCDDLDHDDVVDLVDRGDGFGDVIQVPPAAVLIHDVVDSRIGSRHLKRGTTVSVLPASFPASPQTKTFGSGLRRAAGGQELGFVAAVQQKAGLKLLDGGPVPWPV